MKIFKYSVTERDGERVKMPQDARILSIQYQGDQLCIWAVVSPDSRIVNRILQRIGTGWDIPENLGNYIGTVQDGPFVWHYFDGGEVES